MRLLILADDLTGAADCAVGFAHAGHGAVVALEPAAPGAATQATAWALDTDTRRLAPALAAVRTATAYLAARGDGRHRYSLYKKIDSTLRGPWAAEVAGLQPLAGLAIVAPAHPALGRTVQGGGVLVHGQPLADTDIWRLEHGGRPAGIAEQLHAAGLRTAALDAQALSGQPEALAARIAALAAAGAQALVVDAQTVDALDTLALATLPAAGGAGAPACAAPCPPLFWVGSGGLALALARRAGQLPGAPRAQATQATPVPTLPAVQGPLLVLVGSLSRVSLRQCAQLVQAGGIAECVLPPALLRGGAQHPDWPAQQAHIGAQLAAGRDLLVRIGQDAAFDPAEGAALATALAALVGPHALRAGALLATGGETARALLAAAGIASLQMLGETEPGLALGRVLQARTPQRPLVVTKAGAFGSDEALLRACALLRAPAHPTFPSPKETV
ncbi:MAG TPA: four-carbon acid sugar kinase family protein [Pseudorhodoferax sp.]|nr:four-carbon acid sugar kinase family protein [Pseudorhodoferax sp.]